MPTRLRTCSLLDASTLIVALSALSHWQLTVGFAAPGPGRCEEEALAAAVAVALLFLDFLVGGLAASPLLAGAAVDAVGLGA